MFQFIKEYLESNDGQATKSVKVQFRKRSEHTNRVFIWAKRLIEDELNIDKEAVLVSAIFHDVGYAESSDDYSKHAEKGALICEKYLIEQGFEAKFIEKVVYLVKNHSKKELMLEKDTSKELILLMEADLLDESGALSIVWDCMREGAQEKQTFEKTYKHISDYSGRQLNGNPMVTEKGKAFWANKQRLVQDFINQLGFDLALEVDERGIL